MSNRMKDIYGGTPMDRRHFCHGPAYRRQVRGVLTAFTCRGLVTKKLNLSAEGGSDLSRRSAAKTEDGSDGFAVRRCLLKRLVTT